MKMYCSFVRVSAILAVALLICVSQVYSQGTSITIIDPPNGTRITDCQTGQLVGAGYTAAIFWGPTGANPEQFTQLGGTMPVLNGILAGGTRVVPVPSGMTVNLFAAAWEAAFGATYQEASQVAGARVGTSPVITAVVGPTPIRIPDFQVCPVPEPSTWALIILGFAAAFVRCRISRR